MTMATMAWGGVGCRMQGGVGGEERTRTKANERRKGRCHLRNQTKRNRGQVERRHTGHGVGHGRGGANANANANAEVVVVDERKGGGACRSEDNRITCRWIQGNGAIHDATRAHGKDDHVRTTTRAKTQGWTAKTTRRTMGVATWTWFVVDGWTSWIQDERTKRAWAIPTTPPPNGRVRYLGLATSSSSYGGYGGNENSEDRYKYYYDVPEEWDQAIVNKIEKATNGTDSKFVSKKRGGGGEKIQLLTFPGYASLKPQRAEIMNDLAISDYDLQDILSGAEDIQIRERQVEGVTYVDYDIYSYKTNVLASVAADGGRLYAWFCWIPTGKWEQDEKMARELRESFGVIQRGTEAEIKANLEFYKRS